MVLPTVKQAIGVAVVAAATLSAYTLPLVSDPTLVPLSGLAVVAVSGAKAGQMVSDPAHVTGKYDLPGPNDLVRKCVPTITGGCDWSSAVWMRFIDVAPDEFIDTCQNALNPSTLSPDPWSAAADLCKSWKVVQSSLVPNKVIQPAANGAWLHWPDVTTNVDTTDAGIVAYRVYRGTKVDENGRLDVADKSFKFVQESSTPNFLLTRQPRGKQCYAVSTKAPQGESTLSNAVCKIMKIPAPSAGKIEGPSNGVIEIK